MSDSQSHKPRIFVSHSSKDNSFGLKLVSDLRRILNDDSAVWYDSADGLIGGDSWWQKISGELIARDIFIIILSPDAMDSKWVLRQLDMALIENKIIVPVLYRRTNLRTDLKVLQHISFLDPEQYDTAFTQLLIALGQSPLEAKSKGAPRVTEIPLLQERMSQIDTAFKSQDWLDIIEKIDYVIKNSPDIQSSDIYYKQGVAFFKIRKLKEASKALVSALSLTTDPAKRLTIMQDYAAVLNAENQWNELINLTEEALQLIPNNSDWWIKVQQHAIKRLTRAEEESSLPLTNEVEIFCSYAHKDERYWQELLKRLIPLRRQGLITYWYDRDIDAGTDWKREINDHLNTAQIILLLVSPDFIASDYCYEIEMKRALERHENGKAHVIPVILRPCTWQEAPFSKLQALPKGGKAVNTWTIRDNAYLDIAEGIKRVIKKLLEKLR